MSVFSSRIDPARERRAREVIERMIAGSGPRFVQGTNSHAASIAAHIDISGFIDDFTSAQTFAGRPVLRTEDVPKDATVVSAVLGKVWTAKRRLDAAGLTNVDYYAFHRLSGLPIENPFFWDNFEEVFRANADAFEALHERLSDEESRDTLRDIIGFRRSSDIGWMSGYVDRQDVQYFEDFLRLAPAGETFVDVGAFDGATSEYFAWRCPDYAHIHLFEPEAGNMAVAQARLKGRPRVSFHELGLSDRAQTLRFSRLGSQSRVSEQGDIAIALDRLDSVVSDPITFLKMDIEGAEGNAIAGAASLIGRDRPRIALAAYHRADDFLRLAEQVLAIEPRYELRMRHYTECRDETVLFFIPTDKAA